MIKLIFAGFLCGLCHGAVAQQVQPAAQDAYFDDDVLSGGVSPAAETARAVPAAVKAVKPATAAKPEAAAAVPPEEAKKAPAVKVEKKAEPAASGDGYDDGDVLSGGASLEAETAQAASVPEKTAEPVKPAAVKPAEPAKPAVTAAAPAKEAKSGSSAPSAAENNATAEPVSAQKRSVDSGKKHLVSRGETLWGLSRKYYGDPLRWGQIYKANNGFISNPDLIYPENALEIPGISGETAPVSVPLISRPAGAAQAAAAAAQPAVKKVFAIGADETVKEPEIDSSEVLTEAAAAEQAASGPAVTGRGKTASASAGTGIPPQPEEKLEELFKGGDLSEDMPDDQKEWSASVKIAGATWREDGVITAKAASKDWYEDGLSFTGETVMVTLRAAGLVKKGDYLYAYLKGTSAYKNGKRLGFELQRAGLLEVLSVDGLRAKAKVLDASTAINRGLLVKKK